MIFIYFRHVFGYVIYCCLAAANWDPKSPIIGAVFVDDAPPGVDAPDPVTERAGFNPAALRSATSLVCCV